MSAITRILSAPFRFVGRVLHRIGRLLTGKQ
jgi:hypothetical protein